MSLTFTLRRVYPDPPPAAQSFHQSTTFFPTRGGGVELDPTAPPAAADGADDNENLMSSQLKSDHGDYEFEFKEDIAEGSSSSPEIDAAAESEYEEYLLSTAREYDVDEHSESMSSLTDADDESDDDTMRSFRQGDSSGDEFEEDLMSTGESGYNVDGHIEGYLSTLTERDDAVEIYDDMMRSLRRGDFEYEEDSVATPQSDEGLPEEVIERFLKTTTAAGDQKPAEGGVCAVCLDDLYEGDRAVGVLGCRHGFHGDCIGDWLRMKNDCPLCRAIAIKI